MKSTSWVLFSCWMVLLSTPAEAQRPAPASPYSAAPYQSAPNQPVLTQPLPTQPNQYQPAPYPSVRPNAPNQYGVPVLPSQPMVNPYPPAQVAPPVAPVWNPTFDPRNVPAKQWPAKRPPLHVSQFPGGYVPQASVVATPPPLGVDPAPLPNLPPAPIIETETLIEAETVIDELSEPDEPAVCWETTLELGVNGSAGNSEAFNFRFGVDTKRESDFSILTYDLDYKKDSQDSVDTVNRLFSDARFEWLLGDSPWSLYVHNTVEYDEFKTFDARLAGDAGVGYQFWKNDITELKGRTGAGVSHELGGPDESYPIEATFGLEFTRQISDRQKISASAEYFPEFADFMNARVTGKADWEILLDEATHMSMKLGVVDRYDSTPNGAKHNDLDYTVTLLWKF